MQRKADAKARTSYEPISTVIIGKNCAKNLKECLASLKGFVLSHLGDEVVYLDTGSTDGGKTCRLAKNWGCRVIKRPDLSDKDMIPLIQKYLPEHADKARKDPQFKGGFLRDFSEARTLANDAAQNDLIFWIDTDDVLVGGKDLRALAHTFFSEDKKRNALFLRYDYAHDDDETCTTVLWRERILRKSQYKWLGVCHETLIPRDMNPELAQRCPLQNVFVKHKNHRDTIWSDIRNYVILMNAYDKAKESGGWLDPRWDFYIANALRGMEKLDEAVKWYGRVLKRSGSRDDRFTACLNIAIIYQLRGRYWLSLDWLWQAVKIFPQEPRVWFAIARAYHDLGKHTEAIQFTDFGKQLGNPDLLVAVDPTGYDFYPDIFAAMSFRSLGDYDSMLRCAESALRRRPNWPAAKEIYEAARIERNNQYVKQSIALTCQHAASVDAQKTIIRNLKPEVRKGFRELQLEAPKKRKPGTITYLCGGTHEHWDGSSCLDGIGGSEKMVILLSREWVKQGWDVEVFANPKEENAYKKIDGVTWKPIEAFNTDSEYDVVIGWRFHGFLDMKIKCRKLFMDLHDVQNPADFRDERTMKCDGYFFKSEFHAKPVREDSNCPSEKIIVSRNGVDLSHFEWRKDEEGRFINPFGGSPHPGELVPQWSLRQPKKVVFCSSADRGLKRALKIWQRIQGGHPDAELHIFYGFTPLYRQVASEREYQHFGDEGCERHMLDYEEECYKLIDQMPSVKFHGRVNTETLAAHLMTASAWLYPTHFPEISCMAAMESQVAGAIPVIFPTGALNETVGDIGYKVHSDDGAIQALNKIFNDEAGLVDVRKELEETSRQRFGTDSLAHSWLEYFK